MKEEQKCRNLKIKTHLINFPNEYHVMSLEKFRAFKQQLFKI